MEKKLITLGLVLLVATMGLSACTTGGGMALGSAIAQGMGGTSRDISAMRAIGGLIGAQQENERRQEIARIRQEKLRQQEEQFQQALKQRQSQFDSRLQEQQREFDNTLKESQRQFDAKTQEQKDYSYKINGKLEVRTLSGFKEKGQDVSVKTCILVVEHVSDGLARYGIQPGFHLFAINGKGSKEKEEFKQFWSSNEWRIRGSEEGLRLTFLVPTGEGNFKVRNFWIKD